ncbi:MAG: Fic family protein [Thermoplasmata archaeon]|nr:Fic family protein [Thermoplasmata archaeon]
MCGYQPTFTISAKSINLVSEISSLVTKLSPQIDRMDLKLRRKNRVKSIQSSLEIEANSLTENDVSAIIDGKIVMGPKRDILEVQNAIEAYDLIEKMNPYSIQDLLKLHGIMMRGLVPDAGSFRENGVNVVNSLTKEIIHYGPHPDYVPRFIEELLEWSEKTDHHPLIVSCVFHHEFEFIHPFSDGNGRTGRLWQTLILSKWNPAFEWIPVESIIRDRQKDYYSAIKAATDLNDTSPFIEFMLEAIKDTLCEISVPDQSLDDIILEKIAKGEYTNTSAVAEEMGLSEKTIRRHIASLKEQGLIVREGSDKTGRWIVREQ